MGQFTAWDDLSPVVNEKGVNDYLMHPTYGKKGAPFSSSVVFLINKGGNILKVNGKTPKNSKWDASTFQSIKQFQEKEKLISVEKPADPEPPVARTCTFKPGSNDMRGKKNCLAAPGCEWDTSGKGGGSCETIPDYEE